MSLTAESVRSKTARHDSRGKRNRWRNPIVDLGRVGVVCLLLCLPHIVCENSQLIIAVSHTVRTHIPQTMILFDFLDNQVCDREPHACYVRRRISVPACLEAVPELIPPKHNAGENQSLSSPDAVLPRHDLVYHLYLDTDGNKHPEKATPKTAPKQPS